MLFLDELAEFNRTSLEALRVPLEDGEVLISRATGSVRLPARCIVVAAMNPCPCGHRGDPRRECVCAPGRLDAYRRRISGPLSDRFDLRVEVPRAEAHGDRSEGTDTIAKRVSMARDRLEVAVPVPTGEAERFLHSAVERLALSARGSDRVGRVAATLAALAGREQVVEDDVAEALGYRLEVTR